MLEVGKLYQVKAYYFLYPSMGSAARATLQRAGDRRGEYIAFRRSDASAAAGAAYWSKELNGNVTYISENSIFCFLEEDGKFLKVISTNGELGWIIYPQDEEWNKGSIEEVKEQ